MKLDNALLSEVKETALKLYIANSCPREIDVAHFNTYIYILALQTVLTKYGIELDDISVAK
jgi:hypothetical protein